MNMLFHDVKQLDKIDMNGHTRPRCFHRQLDAEQFKNRKAEIGISKMPRGMMPRLKAFLAHFSAGLEAPVWTKRR
jgi:hypothetical protein